MSKNLKAWQNATQPDTDKNTKRNFFSYFFEIDHRFVDFQYFRKKWRELKFFSSSLNAKELSSILYKIADFSKKNSDFSKDIEDHISENLKTWEDSALYLMGDFNPQDLVSSIWALATLRIKPSDKFLEAWQERSTKTINNFNSQDLSNSLWALATLHIKPSDKFLEAWQERSTKTINNFNSQDLSNSLWAMSVIDLISGHDLLDTAHIVYQKIDERFADKKEKRQIRSSAIWFNFGNPFSDEKSSDSYSSLEDDFFMLINKHGIKEASREISKLGHLFDFTLIGNNGQKIFLELDGPFHFVRDTESDTFLYDGGTLLQSAVLCKLHQDAIIVRLPYEDYRKIINLSYDEQKIVLNALLSIDDVGISQLEYDDKYGLTLMPMYRSQSQQQGPQIVISIPTP